MGFAAPTGHGPQAADGDGGLDRQEAERALRLLLAPDGFHELVSPPWHAGQVGWFQGTDGGIASALEHAARLHGQEPAGVYLGLNPAEAAREGRPKDADIARRRWLFIEFDAKRPDPKGTNATEEEKHEARESAIRCHNLLVCDQGWPEPVVVDSGNGWYLLWRIDTANDDAAKAAASRITKRLSSLYGCDKVVYNAGRVCRLPGTLNRKGPDSPGRPRRMCRLYAVPDSIECVPWDKLRLLAGPEAEPSGQKAKAGSKAGGLGAVPTGAGKEQGGPSATDRARSYLRKTPPAYSGQGGHPAAFWAARVAVWGFDLGEDAGFDLLWAEWNPHCQPPWSEKELRHKCRDADLVPFGKPRGWMLEEDRKGAAGAASAGAEQPKAEAKGKGEEGGASAQPPEWAVMIDDIVVAQGSPGEVLDGTEEEGGGSERKTRVFDLRTLGCLLKTTYPPPRWLIHGIMSEGLNLLVGSPKQGKSLMALNLALTIAGGGKALGDVQVQPASVLYLSLEDQLRRVKERAIRMMRGLPEDVSGPALERLTIVTDWPRQDEGGLRLIDLWRQRAENPGLVIIDVWNRFSPAQKANGNIYMQDAEAVSQVKRYHDRHGMAGLIVHHDRKAQGGKAEEDFVASISGTQGIAGSADGIMVLVRSRQETQAALKITGRDVEERELVLEFDAPTLSWRSLGSTEQHATSRIQQAIMAYLKTMHPNGAYGPDIAAAIKEKPDTVRRTLNRLLEARAVSKRGNLWHWPAEPPEDQGV